MFEFVALSFTVNEEEDDEKNYDWSQFSKCIKKGSAGNWGEFRKCIMAVGKKPSGEKPKPTNCLRPLGEVILREGKYPEIWINDKWSPICGHYFWNNPYGATLFCKKLSSEYTSGKVKNTGLPLASDGVRVGECLSQDKSLSSCTGGCSDYPEVGGQCGGGNCSAGQRAAIEIECFRPGM